MVNAVARPYVYEDIMLWEEQQNESARTNRLNNAARRVEVLGEDLGNSDKDQIASRLAILIAHLLKWEFQPNSRSERWRATIVEQRGRIARVIRRAPSLKAQPAALLGRQYTVGRKLAARDTGMALATFPKLCPYAEAQILDEEFFPGDQGDAE